jgi:Tfp pilus assembly PilM family ATPase
MSLFFPVHRPSTGLSVTERGLALVELQRGWQKPGIVRVTERSLPVGMLALSASEPNVKDRAALVKELRALVASTSERTIALCLSDRICHLAVFSFETLPPRERDRGQIIRWRFQHEEHVPVGDARILHRAFPVQGAGAKAYVLAMAIKRSVLDQYEQVCQEAGLLPISISCAALWLFDFYRPMLTQENELFFVHQASDSMTCLAIKQGLPVFCRMKAQRAGQADMMGELQSTLQFYEDLHPTGVTGSVAYSSPIYMVGEGCSRKWPAFNGTVEVNDISDRYKVYFSNHSILPDWKTLVSTNHGTISSEEGLYALACAGGR